MQLIRKYFPELSELQIARFARLDGLYREWNARINVISRKDIDNLYLHHVLHSLAIAKAVSFRKGMAVMDVGTGGGFPGIPLAILYPEVSFRLVDSIGKKVRVAEAIARELGLENVVCVHENVKEEKGRFDRIVSRAVTLAPELAALVRKNIRRGEGGELVCLKGGDTVAETASLKGTRIYPISEWFDEDFFETKNVTCIPL